MQSITERIAAETTFQWADNQNWHTHIVDHLAFLKEDATLKTISDRDFKLFGKRPVLLLQRLNIPREDIYILLVINQISTVTGLLNHQKTLIVPKQVHLQRVRDSFENTI